LKDQIKNNIVSINKLSTALLSMLLFIIQGLSAQEKKDSTEQLKELDEIIISGSKFAEKKKNIVQKIYNISSNEIRNANTQNIGDLLINTGNVFVQKSQQGGSSPVIRGFEASRILLVVDGIRMNNAIYRSGHLQNAITVDQNMLSSIEVLQGPASTLFGSDALGGAIHMMTRQPQLSTDKNKTNIKGSAFSRFSSANNEKTIHADINVGWKKIGILSSITLSDYGDTKIGSHDKKGFELFGTRPYYIDPFNGYTGDTILKNNNDRIQKFSGYTQMDLLQKILFNPNEKTAHTINIQHSTSSNIPRYDRLQDVKNGKLRFASWYYGPQNRSLFAYNLNLKKQAGFFGEYNGTISYQLINESRFTREYKKYDQFDKRNEEIGVGGLTIDARRKMIHDELTAGIDVQTNNLKSTAYRTNLISKLVSKLDTRYPDGKNTMYNAAIYLQHIHKFINEKWILNDGIRFQYTDLRSNIIDNSFFLLPVTKVRQKTSSVTGNVGFAYSPSKDTRINLGFSAGFRAPNIDDLSKIFESSTSLKQVVVPNTNLKPEYTGTFEAGLNQAIVKDIQLEISAYYTNFTNAIIKSPFKLNGQDSIVYNNVKSQVLASQNVNHAFIYGGNIMVTAKTGKSWFLSSSINFTKGRFITDENKSSSIYQIQPNGLYAIVMSKVRTKPLDHIPPIFGKISIAYKKKNIELELFLLFNGWKKLDQYNADGEDNAQYATKLGTPSWQTLNFKTSYRLNKLLRLQAAVENLFDLNYRFFASGFSAPGRNFIVSLRTDL
jgi:hemoglobin/transferrin/lactoferrin receptor protein